MNGVEYRNGLNRSYRNDAHLAGAELAVEVSGHRSIKTRN